MVHAPCTLLPSVTTREKTSLLIVDDDAPIRKLLERVAVRAGFEVGLAKDGIEALERLAERPYNIAIIDLMMPRLSGYDLVQKISTMNPRPIVIVATAMTNADVARIDDTLVRHVIRKPFDVQAVAETLIETARHIAGVSIAPPESATIRVSAKDVGTETEEQKKKDPQQPDAKLN